MKRQKLLVLATTTSFGVIALTASAVAQSERPPAATSKTSDTRTQQAASEQTRAIAILRPTQGSNVSGVVTFEETSDGVRAHTNVRGLPGGEHAYHVHVYGDCSAPDATSAGPHFRFGPADTGITGNLGELMGAGGQVTNTTLLREAKLDGERSIIGRAVVVHEKGNDPSQPPDGAAGARIACGVIGLDEASSGGAQAGGAPTYAP